jgi:hypothetical protein
VWWTTIVTWPFINSNFSDSTRRVTVSLRSQMDKLPSSTDKKSKVMATPAEEKSKASQVKLVEKFFCKMLNIL